MVVRYNSVFPVVLIVLGVVDVVLALALRTMSSSAGSTATVGALVAVVGIAQLNRAYFEYDPATSTIAVKSRFGLVKRRFGGMDGGLLLVENDRIFYIRADGRKKLVPVVRFFARGDQWRAVLEQIRQAPVTGPAPM